MENTTQYSTVGFMNSTGFVSLSEAAERLGVGKEQVRRYVQRGLLPGTKLANIWVVPVADLQAFRHAKPRGGRPLSAATAWAQIIAGDVNLDDPHRYINRGVLTRWAGAPGGIADLLADDSIVIGGIHAAQIYGALLAPLPNEAQIYIERSTTIDVMMDFVPDPLGGVVVRSVDTAIWQELQEASNSLGVQRSMNVPETALCAPPAAVALDLVPSKHPREQYVADVIMDSL